MENQTVLNVLAGIGAVSILIWAHNKFIAKPKPTTNTVSSILNNKSILCQ